MNVHQFQRLQALVAPFAPVGDPAELNALLESLDAALSPLQRALVCKPRAVAAVQGLSCAAGGELDHSFSVRVGLIGSSLLCSAARWLRTMSSFASVSSCRLLVLGPLSDLYSS